MLRTSHLIPSARRARGFTLLEVLVVILMVGLLASTLTLAQSDHGPQHAKREAERLRSLLGLLREDAMLERQELGVRIEPDGYTVHRLDADGRWLPASDYRPQQLPDSLRLHLELGEQAPGLGAPVPGPGPQLLVLSSDELTPFSLQIEVRGRPVLELSSDGLEEVRVEPL
ncbi:type II secretion system minor pseudopilin GspH [Pseudomonas sp. ENNP23]|uniref:type II secretion system minor pseudopilin GspH n=1 Tax=Pseudomonas sp. ENNP23 TaxID=1535636 RepID=UPI00084AAF80|nr:type II secretion system minor pseudopilin GspH [Pseudomonas sp. ENNP23]OEC52421.1 type II secretion system protein GspH [Pseudomonas sp. ENNP23]